MKTKTLLSVLAAAALPAALPAAEMSFEGRWLLGGRPQESVDSTCEVRFYGTADAATPAATATAVPFRTDSDGYFAVQADVPAGMPDAFWAGVKPDGADEIVPRMCVAPVPYALAAAEAVLVTNDVKLVLSGSATVERVVAAGDATVDQWTIPPGGAVKATNLQTSSVRLVDVETRPGAALGLFAADGGDVSPDFDSFVGDSLIAELSKDSILFQGAKAKKTANGWWNARRDGFALIALKATLGEKATCPEVTVAVGPTVVVNALPIGSKRGKASVVKRFVCVPVRAGEKVEVTLVAKGAAYTGFEPLSQFKPIIEAKVGFVSFGRE